MFRCGDPCIAQPEGRFAETGARRYGEEFCCVPAKWQLKRPDSNIDHRRVPNLETGLPATIKHAPPARTPVTIKRAILSRRLDNGLAHWGGVRWLRPRQYAAGDITLAQARRKKMYCLAGGWWGTIGILLNKRSPHMKKKIQILYTDGFFSYGSPAPVPVQSAQYRYLQLPRILTEQPP